MRSRENTMEPTVTKNEARQGPRGRPVLYVLIGALALCGVYMIGLMTWSSNQAPDYASQSQGASREQITGSSTGQSNAPSSANSARVPAGNPAYPVPSTPSATGSTNTTR